MDETGADEQTVRRIRNSSPSPERYITARHSGGPVDTNGVAYWSCVVLGISSLLPWNLFITAHGYFSYKFRHLNGSRVDNATVPGRLEASFEVYFALTASTSAVVAALGNIAMASHVSSHKLMISSHALVISTLLTAFIFTFVDTDKWQTGFLWLSLMLIVFSQVGCTIMAGSSFGLAALLPEARFTNAVISAQAFAGIFTAVISILSTAVGTGYRPSLVGAVYFAMALVFVLFSLAVYFSLMKNSYAQFYIKRAAISAETDDTEPLLVDPQVDGDNVDANGDRPPVDIRQNTLATFIRKTFYHGVSLTMTLAATLICFPALTSLVRSTVEASSSWHIYFIPVACFLFFNTMDFIGRLLGNCKLWPKRDSPLIGLFVLLRFGFVFLFLFCNLPPYGMDGTMKIFRHDIFFVVFVLGLGLTNGYLANLTTIYLPASVDKSDSDRAGAATATCLAVGVLVGSLISFFVVNYVNS